MGHAAESEPTHRTERDVWGTRQEGYGAFSVSASQTDGVVAYIGKQAAHHARRNYEEEFVELLRRYGISYDPEHVLG